MEKYFCNFFISLVTISSLFVSCSEKKQDIRENKILQNKKVADSVYNQTPLVLWFTQPALQRDTTPYANGATTHSHGNPENKGWDEALPIGNGRMAAMVFGGIQRERIQLNEESLWSGKKVDDFSAEAATDLVEIRKLIFEGRHQEAQLLAEQKLTGKPQNISYYQSLADVFIDFTNIGDQAEITDYYRDLHIDSAITTVHYRVSDKLYTREAFASHVDDIVVIRITCNYPNSINANISLTREAESETFRSPFDSTLLIQRGKLSDNGLLFETQLKVAHKGGKVDNETKKLICENVDTLTLYISAATNFKTKEHALFAKQTLLKAMAKPYSKLKTDHIADYKKLFNRVEFNLTSADKAYDVPTDKRVERVKNGNADKYLTELMFQYGRYLLISSSRPGSLPANMQGKWNEHIKPEFGSGYKIEWTLPLVYSAADVTNLSECEEPLLRMIESSATYGAETAQKMYGLNGWVAHDFLSIYGNNYPTTHQLESIPPIGATWLVTSLYDSYLFHGDKELLKTKLFPLMKNASTFMLDYLVEIPQGLNNAGKLVACPSLSEENEFEKTDGSKIKLSFGSAMDQQLIYDLFQSTINAIDQLSSKNIKIEPKFRVRLVEAMAKLATVPINQETGEIQEWVEDYETANTGKNYVSQLYGLYPSSQISRNSDPVMTKAAEQCLINEVPRLKKSSHGNALAAIWWARLGRPDDALLYLNKQISESTSPNLLSSNPPFFIDGNMIFTSAVAEMLLQSHDNILEFLPAEPSILGEGYVRGLRARSGFVCDLTWANGKVLAKVKSNLGNKCTIRINGNPKVILDGKPVKIEQLQTDLIAFNTRPGDIFEVSYAGGIKKGAKAEKGKSNGIDLGIDLGIRIF
ncbi:MAG: glycosyl hydrolase family 95 catalytic domain-containing protein [Cytophagales bacterium]